MMGAQERVFTIELGFQGKTKAVGIGGREPESEKMRGGPWGVE